ncbi:uncharacterized protein LOC125479822 isoform X1 [Pyrus x bretschneideri]|uniref:uncharacterized protein LOC125479822 isoform X1 n=1 Tax=Pyrus x bretschneideri TaxID=225117 RepID=UPI00202E6BC2|nr:uncharacterized protein LOC125479822 isoform X1 [Pyrus x bretschneideri]
MNFSITPKLPSFPHTFSIPLAFSMLLQSPNQKASILAISLVLQVAFSGSRPSSAPPSSTSGFNPGWVALIFAPNWKDSCFWAVFKVTGVLGFSRHQTILLYLLCLDYSMALSVVTFHCTRKSARRLCV